MNSDCSTNDCVIPVHSPLGTSSESSGVGQDRKCMSRILEGGKKKATYSIHVVLTTLLILELIYKQVVVLKQNCSMVTVVKVLKSI